MYYNDSSVRTTEQRRHGAAAGVASLLCLSRLTSRLVANVAGHATRIRRTSRCVVRSGCPWGPAACAIYSFHGGRVRRSLV